MRKRRLLSPAGIGTVIGVGLAVALALSATVLLNRPSAGAHPAPSAPTSPSGKAQPALPRHPTLVIAHRGASARSPEHTIAAYRLAIEMGADYIEADLSVTHDGVLVARHERELSATTDIARHPEFAGRRVTKQVDTAQVTNWFVEDFTLAELKTLRATIRRGPGGPQRGASAPPSTAPVPPDERIPTIDEMINLVRSESMARGRQIGLYLELKQPSFYGSIGLAPEPPLALALQHADLARRDAPVFIESFDPTSLRTMHAMVDVPLVQLISSPESLGQGALETTAQYAAGVGVDRSLLVARVVPGQGPSTPGGAPSAPGSPAGTGSPGTSGANGVPTVGGVPAHGGAPTSGGVTASGGPGLGHEAAATDPGTAASADDGGLDRSPVETAHRFGLEVHVYTFSDPEPTDPVLAAYRSYAKIGVDGVFTDNPDFALRALR